LPPLTLAVGIEGIVEVSDVIAWLGLTDADLQRYHIDPSSPLVTFALVVAIVKTLDVLGLVPLRWMLTIFLTPRVARFLTPLVERVSAAFRAVRGPRP